jgi:propanol-preferring alcohol dehydrogenase
MLLKHTLPAEENPLVMSEMPIPEPGPHEILIRVSACGVCHTDLHTVEGDLRLRKLPIIPGHQVVGIVADVGERCNIHRKGDRVGVTWFFSSCGSCKFCRKGLENLCDHARFTGFDEHGGYAEYLTVPETSAFHVPSGFSDIAATPLLCGGVIGFRAYKLTGIASGANLGLYGFGNSAHIVIQIANKAGCKVHVFTRSSRHQELARELGAVWVGSSEAESSTKMDASIVFAPAGQLVPQALSRLDKGGTLVLAGITMTTIPQMDYELLYWEKRIRTVANTTRNDAAELLRFAAEVPVKSVVESFPLRQANKVLQMMKSSSLRAGAALVI